MKKVPIEPTPVQELEANSTDNLLRIPPFEDAHMHFNLCGRPWSEEVLRAVMERYARRGIFSIKDMGHKSAIGLKARIVAKGLMSVRTAAFALIKKGGYGTFLGKCVEGKEEIKKAVKEISDAGADFIKVINSGIVSTGTARHVTEGGFTFEELKVICAEAKKRDLEIACHANSDNAIRDAVMAGVSSLEHGFFISGDTIRLMVEKGTSWTPTAFALLALAPSLAPTEKRHIQEVIEGHLASMYFAASIGLKLRVGTDSGSKGTRHGESYFDELRLFEKAGLTLSQILSSACMEEEKMETGNFLLVGKDFISTGKVVLPNIQA